MIKKFFLKILLSKAGPYITGAVATGLGAGVAQLAVYGVVIEPDQVNELAAATAAVLISVVQGFALGSVANGVKEIQQATRVVQDGVPGPVTVEAVKDAVTSDAKKLPKLGGAGK